MKRFIRVPVAAMIALAIGCKIAIGSSPNQESEALPVSMRQARASFENSVGMKMVFIPPGAFVMGVPEDAWQGPYDNPAWPELHAPREVTISEPFYMSAMEVTNEQYSRFVGESGYPHAGSSALKQGPRAKADAPLTSVSWRDARAFCRWLSRREGVSYELPTEAQWEYACRGGSYTLFSFGDEAQDLPWYAWFEQNSGGYPHEVGMLRPNAWGLYDMHGNVWEWCRDIVPKSFLRKGEAPPDLLKGPVAFVRGGAYSSRARNCWAGVRWTCYPVDTRDSQVGFRVICPAREETEGDIFRAVTGGDVEAVRSMIKQNPLLVNSRRPDKHPLLVIAAQGDHWDLVELLVNKGADVNAASTGGTALHYAASKGKGEVVAFLLENGADPNAEDMIRRTPLYHAVWQGHEDIVSLLLARGATVNVRDKHGTTPLHNARTVAVARLLLEAGADVNAKNEDGLTALDLAVHAWGLPSVAELLREHGARQ